MHKSVILPSLLVLLMLFSLPDTLRAQQEKADDGLLEDLQEAFQQDYLSLGVLLQGQGEFHWDAVRPGENTFRVPTARLKVYGGLDQGFGYTLQTDFTGSPSVLDAQMSYTYSEFLKFTAGAMKPGISAEYLTSAASTDFINRSRIVNTLVGNRDIGALMEVQPAEGLQLSAGIFNGTNQRLTNNDNNFYLTARLTGVTEWAPGRTIEVGVNAAHSREGGTRIGNRTLPAIIGDRTVYGGDIRLEADRFMVSTEVLGSELEYGGGFTDKVYGFHLTGGYRVSDALQVVARYDYLESDLIPLVPGLVLGGINYNVTDAASFQVNYEVNPDDPAFANHRLLAQMQIAF